MVTHFTKPEVDYTLLVAAQMQKLRLDKLSALPQASVHCRGGCSLLRYMLPHAMSGTRQHILTPRPEVCLRSGISHKYVSGIVQEGPP